MSFTIASTSSPFDENIHLDTTSTPSGDLQGRQVHDFTNVPFYKKALFIRTTAMIGSVVLSAAMFYYGAAHLDLRLRGSWLKGLDIFCLIAPWIIGPIGVIWGYLYKGYQDPEDRYQFRMELLDGTITLNQFIQKHGWDNVRRWGFFLPEDQEPLCTKAQIADFILESAKDRQLERYFKTYQYSKGVLIVRGEYFDTTYTFHYYRPEPPVLWEAISHNVFSEGEKKEFTEVFEKIVFQMRGTNLLENWSYMKEVGENTNPKLAKLYDWLEKNEARYQMLTRAYRQRAAFLILRVGIQMNLDEPFDKNLPSTPREILDSMPKYVDGWLTSRETHVQQLNELNKWFIKELAKIDLEFMVDFATNR